MTTQVLEVDTFQFFKKKSNSASPLLLPTRIKQSFVLLPSHKPTTLSSHQFSIVHEQLVVGKAGTQVVELVLDL